MSPARDVQQISTDFKSFFQHLSASFSCVQPGQLRGMDEVDQPGNGAVIRQVWRMSACVLLCSTCSTHESKGCFSRVRNYSLKMTAMVITHHMDLMCLRIAIVQLFTKGASWRAAITTYLINVDSTLDAPNPFISLYLYYPCGKMKQTMPTAGYSHNSHEAKQESEVSEDGTNGRSCKCERSS